MRLLPSISVWGFLLSASLCAAVGHVNRVSAEETALPAESKTGMRVPDFEMQDFRGKVWKLSDFQDRKAVVYVFLGTECPMAAHYAIRLAEIQAAYQEQGVAIVGIDSNRQDSVTEMAAFAARHKLEFPLLKDLGNSFADAVGAQRTPEVFVADAQGNVCYRGRIDDQFGVGYRRPQPEKQFLKEALDQVLAGQTVSQPETDVVGCVIGRMRTPLADSEVTYSNQVSRILQQHCVHCHRPGEIAPFALTEYSEVAGWSEMIGEVVDQGRMPPWHANPEVGHFANDIRLSDEERQLIAKWVAAGAPEGDPSQLPPPREFVTGWQLPREPDLVIAMADKPYSVPATGTVPYIYFEVDPGFKEDTWIQASECVPGNRAVVHHMVIFVRTPEDIQNRRRRLEQNFLVGFAPGTRPFVLPDGMAKRVRAGSKLVFQMHYTPNGTAGEDISKVGFILAKPESITHEVHTAMAANPQFKIPPGDNNHEVQSFRPLNKDVILLSLFPHMHLRGKSFHYDLVHADGTKEALLDIPRYDFNWQNHFILQEHRALPAGSRIHCVAHFDNSADNLANPDPTATVRWGDQTWEEMMIGYFDVAIPVE